MARDLQRTLEPYLSAAYAPGPARIADDFDQVVKGAPRALLAQAISDALRSNQALPFAHLSAQLFDHADPQQRADMLNLLLGSLTPQMLNALGGVLGTVFQGSEPPAPVTCTQAATVAPEQVRHLAEQAMQHEHTVIDRMGAYLAAHPALFKNAGNAALPIVLRRVAEGLLH